MLRNPKKNWLITIICCLIAMGLAWGASRLMVHQAAEADAAISAPEANAEIVEDAGRAVEQSAEDAAAALSDSSVNDSKAAATEIEGLDEVDPEYEPAFVMPEGAEYEPNVVLVTVADGVTADQVNSLLAETDAVATKEISEDEVASGTVLLEVAEGVTVEEAVNALLGSEELDGAQPDYIYRLQLGTSADLRARLAASYEPPEIVLLEGQPSTDADDQQEAAGEEASSKEEGAASGEEAPDGDDTPAEGDVPTSGGEDSLTTDGDEGTDPEGEVTEPEDGTEAEPTEEAGAEAEDEAAAPAEDQNSDDQAADTKESPEDTKKDEQPTGPMALQAAITTNDPKLSSLWALDSMNVRDAWIGARAEGAVTVAIVDQYPDVTHEDLSANVVGMYDANDGSTSYTLKGKHGTHVAGIISAVANNKKGVAGVSYNAGLLCINAFSSTSSSATTSTRKIANGITYAARMADALNVRVINLSIGMYNDHTDQLIADAITNAYYNYDVVVVAAAGNADLNNYHIPFQEYPGDTEEAVSVIGLTQNSDGTVTRASDSNYNVAGQTTKDICAPGSNIYSTTPNNTYGTLGGTSMASAEVSGVFALMFAARPSLTAPEAIGILYATAKDLGSAGWDEGYGYGEVDALAAVTQVQPWSVNVSMDSTSFTYTGSAITPSVSVSLTDGTALSEGTDYIVSYTSNVDAGTAAATVVGSGAYKDAGFASKAFTITPASLSGASVTVAKKTNSYTGAAIKPGVTVKLDGKTLTASKDYTVSYRNNVAVGTATVTVTGKGNYKGSASATFTIVASPSVQYRTHVQNVGWQSYVTNGATAGTSGRGLRLEAIQVKLGAVGYAGSIQYRTHIQNIGWESSWKSDGTLSGTSGKGLRLEAIQIKLTGAVAEHFDVYYRVHAQNFGWLGWAKNGDSAGTAGYGYRLEAIQIKLVPKGGSAPGTTVDSFKAKLVSYRTHVQNVGWQSYVYDGQVSGTSGQSLRLEGINIALGNLGYSGSVQYMTHIQNIGWESSWRSNGALSGTSGRALRLEAIRVRLTGDMAKRYDVYYRVHAQNFGWLGWAKNGDSAGTAGYGYRLEAIQIKLVPKGGAAPGTTKNAFRQK